MVSIYKRRKTRTLFLGKIKIGSAYPITLQSMTNTPTNNLSATLRQVKELAKEGVDIIRLAIEDQRAIENFCEIQKKTHLPLIADIQFDARLAIQAIQNGAAGIRINPGNIGGKEDLAEIIKEAKKGQTAIRIGINSGSLEKDLLKKYRSPTAEALVESAVRTISFFEDLRFYNFKISLKSSDIFTTMRAYKTLASKVNYPFHLGITEAGRAFSGTVSSAIGIGALLSQGIGDTLRVSLTADPLEEVKVGKEILKVLGLRNYGPRIISCPTCSRCKVDLIALTAQVEEEIKNIPLASASSRPLKIAMMGCAVNGPGEAREADLGIAFGKKEGILFKRGKIIKRVTRENCFTSLIKEIRSYQWGRD